MFGNTQGVPKKEDQKTSTFHNLCGVLLITSKLSSIRPKRFFLSCKELNLLQFCIIKFFLSPISTEIQPIKIKGIFSKWQGSLPKLHRLDQKALWGQYYSDFCTSGISYQSIKCYRRFLLNPSFPRQFQSAPICRQNFFSVRQTR